MSGAALKGERPSAGMMSRGRGQGETYVDGGGPRKERSGGGEKHVPFLLGEREVTGKHVKLGNFIIL